MAIQINVNVGLDAATSSVEASGKVIYDIQEDELYTFNIRKDNLEQLVSKYLGKAPNDAYLYFDGFWACDPYKHYRWPQVKVNVVVQSATILGITSEPQIVNTQKISNNSSLKGNFNVAITQQVNNTSQSSWSSSEKICSSDLIWRAQKILYSIGFLGKGVEGETSINYEHLWGQGGSESKSVTIGTSSGVSVSIDPGESILAELCASRGVMKVRLVYNAYLTGICAAHYEQLFNDQHYWAIEIGTLLSAGGISNSVQITEDIEISFFMNSAINIKDGAGKATLLYSSDAHSVE